MSTHLHILQKHCKNNKQGEQKLIDPSAYSVCIIISKDDRQARHEQQKMIRLGRIKHKKRKDQEPYHIANHNERLPMMYNALVKIFLKRKSKKNKCGNNRNQNQPFF